MNRENKIVLLIHTLGWSLLLIGVCSMIHTAIYGDYIATKNWSLVSIFGILIMLGSIGYWGLFLVPKGSSIIE